MNKCICGECDHLQASYTWIPDYCEFYIEPHDNKCEKFKPLPPKPPTKDEIIKSLEKELAELKEKYRWRVQGKENAPDWECILYITKNKEVRMDVGRGLEDGERWMPLPDLPKEANP